MSPARLSRGATSNCTQGLFSRSGIILYALAHCVHKRTGLSIRLLRWLPRPGRGEQPLDTDPCGSGHQECARRHRYAASPHTAAAVLLCLVLWRRAPAPPGDVGLRLVTALGYDVALACPRDHVSAHFGAKLPAFVTSSMCVCACVCVRARACVVAVMCGKLQ